MRKNMIALTATTIMAAGAIPAVSASPAYADGRFGCDYPRVCFYLTSADWLARKPTSAFRDITRHFQKLGPRARYAYAAYNSRIDDSAWLEMSDGSQTCLGPDDTWFFDQADGPQTVIGVQIVDENECYRP
ncbi:hypothetical protein Aph02nite_80560 [Actinoplanes philippinensis]|uniref:Peptidase inhibitor family I36 n=1 Tax=Actinoplanes philippinensis TaxID=35752 RepID=A0A1I2KR84_9ACTN|nr:hypothetical protein [Actinoplanes philippinensis]GIE82106.1 hypothetical protein Aph02nite_80560 [Actinoplanes philippinensis]SFF69532.1 hypothetical protein SAMN05421541_11868 [Actinoplanes philippinensis]